VNPNPISKPLGIVASAALLVALAGCGSDESGQTTAPSAPTQVSIPSPTSPIPTTATAPNTVTTGKKKKQAAGTTTSTGGSAPCTIPDAYQDFKFTGLDCSAAVALATEWDSMLNQCNTVDNPNVDEGYNRTCGVQGFTCRAKRDVKSDARFVSCAQGGQSVRFTWLPA
jgi:hypothetical protein